MIRLVGIISLCFLFSMLHARTWGGQVDRYVAIGASARVTLWHTVIGNADLFGHSSVYLAEGDIDGELCDPPGGVLTTDEEWLKPISRYCDEKSTSATILAVQMDFVTHNRAALILVTQSAGGRTGRAADATWQQGEWQFTYDGPIEEWCGFFSMSWICDQK